VVSLNLNENELIPPTQSLDNLKGDALKDALKEWFLSNFEDPAENTPYESAEGGYQYIWGGPYDARDQIEGNFGDQISQEIIDEVVDNLQSVAWDWAPNSNRIYDEDPPDDADLNPYDDLQLRLQVLEQTIAKLEPVSSLIGGNHPPEEIGVPPYKDEDKKEIFVAIHMLRKPQEEIAKEPEKAIAAAIVLKTRGEKLKDFFEKNGDKFVENFSAQLGRRAADSLTVALWLKLAAALAAAYAAAHFLFEIIGIVPTVF
jgi:hypothetical protein